MNPEAAPDGADDAARSAGQRVRQDRRPRLQALAGATVRGSDGRTVGRVRDVYLHDATGELAAITVMPRQLSARSVLIPASAIAALPELPEDDAAPRGEAHSAEAWTGEAWTGSAQEPHAPTDDDPDAVAPQPATSEQGGDHVLHLRVDARTAKAGAAPPHTLHTAPQELRAAAAALGLEEEPSSGRPRLR